MNHDDPLDTWLLVRRVNEFDPKDVARRQAEAHEALDQLTNVLDNPPVRWTGMRYAGLWGSWNAVGFAPVDLARAQELYRQVYITGGAGSSYIQESLLSQIAAAEDPTSIPFWLEILDLSRPR